LQWSWEKRRQIHWLKAACAWVFEEGRRRWIAYILCWLRKDDCVFCAHKLVVVLASF
jgi:hypothetical protein